MEHVKALEVILSSAIMSKACLPSPGEGIAHLAKLVCTPPPLYRAPGPCSWRLDLAMGQPRAVGCSPVSRFEWLHHSLRL